MSFRAWLNSLLMGEGETEQEAIDAAVFEFERLATYDGWPSFDSRESFIAALTIDAASELGPQS